MNWRTFVCKEGNHNKMAQYAISDDGRSVHKKWGRIGGHIDSQVKSCNGQYACQRYVDQEIAKKVAKGYVETNEEKLDVDHQVAATIGTRWKINRVEFLNESFDMASGGHSTGHDTSDLALGQDYRPECGVFVELMESWKHEYTYLVINKTSARQYTTCNKINGRVNLSGGHYPASQFVAGIRLQMQSLYKAVEEVLIKFAAVGVRMLSIGDDEDTATATPMVQAFRAVASTSGVSTQALSKFAAIGNRALEI